MSPTKSSRSIRKVAAGAEKFPHIPLWAYESAYWVGRFFLKLYGLRFIVSGLENLPKGGFLIAANHKSLCDPPFLSFALRLAGRRPFFLGKRELFKNPLLSALLKSVGSVPLARGMADIGALKISLALLERGEVLAIFPQGTRRPAHELERFLPGIGFLALKSRVPVVPAYISDFGKFPGFGSAVQIRLGIPIPYEKIAKYDAKEVAQSVLDAVRRLSHEQ